MNTSKQQCKTKWLPTVTFLVRVCSSMQDDECINMGFQVGITSSESYLHNSLAPVWTTFQRLHVTFITMRTPKTHWIYWEVVKWFCFFSTLAHKTNTGGNTWYQKIKYHFTLSLHNVFILIFCIFCQNHLKQSNFWTGNYWPILFSVISATSSFQIM